MTIKQRLETEFAIIQIHATHNGSHPQERIVVLPKAEYEAVLSEAGTDRTLVVVQPKS